MGQMRSFRMCGMPMSMPMLSRSKRAMRGTMPWGVQCRWSYCRAINSERRMALAKPNRISARSHRSSVRRRRHPPAFECPGWSAPRPDAGRGVSHWRRSAVPLGCPGAWCRTTPERSGPGGQWRLPAVAGWLWRGSCGSLPDSRRCPPQRLGFVKRLAPLFKAPASKVAPVCGVGAQRGRSVGEGAKLSGAFRRPGRWWDGGRAISVEHKGAEWDEAAVVSPAAVHVLARSLKGRATVACSLRLPTFRRRVIPIN